MEQPFSAVPCTPLSKTNQWWVFRWFFFRDMCKYVVDLFKTQRASAFRSISFHLWTLHNYHTSHLSFMVMVIFCGLIQLFEGWDEHQFFQNAYLHIHSLNFLHWAPDALDRSFAFSLWAWNNYCIFQSLLLVSSYPLLFTSSHSPSVFSFINSFARKLQMSF